MIKSSSHIILIFCFILSCTSSKSQSWVKIDLKSDNSDTSAFYRWEAANAYHFAYGDLILLKSGRFIYNSERPFDTHQYSEGLYIFKKDTLIINSEFQPGNLPIKIEYCDSTTTVKQDRRLSFAQNLNGVKLWTARYLLNNDTSIAGTYYADFPLDVYPKNYLSEIKTLKIEVSQGITSQWMPILESNKYIIVTVLSKHDFNEYQPKVLTKYKFLKLGNRLIDLSGGL